MRRLEGKVAIVTGATRGIGAETARLFASEGARVVLAGRNVERGEKVTQDILSSGGEAVFFRTDVGVESDVKALLEQTEQHFGELHVLINNAAATEAQVTSPVEDYTTEEFDLIVKVSLYGTFWCCKYGLPMIVRAGGGSVVNMSSGGAVQGFPGLPAYSAGKSGIHGLTRNIATDYGPRRVRANVIAVGLVRDELTEALWSAPGMSEAMLDLQMTRHTGVPADIASLALYLSSDESVFLTGQVIRMDGGITLKGGLTPRQVDDAYEAGRP